MVGSNRKSASLELMKHPSVPIFPNNSGQWQYLVRINKHMHTTWELARADARKQFRIAF